MTSMSNISAIIQYKRVLELVHNYSFTLAGIYASGEGLKWDFNDMYKYRNKPAKERKISKAQKKKKIT